MYQPQIDHVILNVRGALDETARAFADLGFSLSERNHHPFGSSNHLIVFAGEYIEILGMEAGAAASDGALSARRLGLMGLVFRPPVPVEQMRQAYLQQQLEVGRSFSFSRLARLPNGQQATASFDLLYLPDTTTEDGAVFFCQHHAPSLVWNDAAGTHANGACAIQELVVAAQDPLKTLRGYTPYFQAGRVQEVPGGYALRGDRSTLRIVRPPEAAQRVGSGGGADLEVADRFVGLVLASADMQRTQAFFQRYRGGARVHREAQRVRLEGPGLQGCALAFEPVGEGA